MAYLNQPWFNREIINRFAMTTGVVHSQTLTVIKRASKQPQKIPVTPVEVDGVKYLGSTRGASQWVKNVRVDPNVTLTTKSGTTKYVATEIPVENRQPIIEAYKVKAGKISRATSASCPIQPTTQSLRSPRRPDSCN
jgi:F420H(2)-dependent quinone reductase